MIQLKIIEDKCIKCGRCVSVCPALILKQESKRDPINIYNLHTCIGCGHCVAICPTDAVDHSLFPPEKVHSIDRKTLPSSDSIMDLLHARRSNRSFSNKEVPTGLLDKILEAAHLAPSASNGQTLQYTLITNPEILKTVIAKNIEIVNSFLKKLNNPVVKLLLKLFSPNVLKVVPMLEALSKKHKQGYDPILRGAKAVLLIHSPKSKFGVADANLAYQNASLMAESLGVGHFYTGYVCAFASEDKKGIIRKSVGIKGEIYAGMALGMPMYTFDKYIDRKEQIVTRL